MQGASSLFTALCSVSPTPITTTTPFVYVCVCVCVQDYKLNFGLWEKHAHSTWHGGVATIESHPGAEVWGVIWTLSNENLGSLDK